MTCVDIPVRLHDLFQGIGAINDRLQLSVFGQLLQQKQIVDRKFWPAMIHRHICAVVGQGSFALLSRRGMYAASNGDEDEVIDVTFLREVFLPVVGARVRKGA